MKKVWLVLSALVLAFTFTVATPAAAQECHRRCDETYHCGRRCGHHRHEHMRRECFARCEQDKQQCRERCRDRHHHH